MYSIINVKHNTNKEEILQNLIELHLKHDYKTIQKIFKTEHDIKHDKSEASAYKYHKNSGMIFCGDDNSLISIRIYVDKETRHILNTLLIVSSNLIDEKRFVDLIISQWIKDIQSNDLLNNITSKNVVKENYIQLKVGKRCWNDLSDVCKTKCISMRCGFKMSILKYLNGLCQHYNEVM